MDINELNVILEKHKKWIIDENDGESANLSGVDLSGINLFGANLKLADLPGANLSEANLAKANLSWTDLSKANLSKARLYETNLSEANLSGADLIDANLKGANLFDAHLFGANLSKANLSWANLAWADLSGANLSEANLLGANLFGANLVGAKLPGAELYGTNLSRAKLKDPDLRNVEWDTFTAFYSIACPEEGAFIGWKKTHDKIVKLRITEDAKRSSATSRKCRCSKAEVLEIQNIDGSISDLKSVSSNYDNSFLYTVGETVEVPDFDDDRWDECSQGIHFFITRQEAVNY